ncbi:MAG TPA: twin-arginine translocase TatA/TatE family subunit [Solirubrobacteraceae bacterium]|nr:twin-arginine translocase TatA/TatE family subunit [Solirubrobacteraceae bacterium]
MGLENPVHLLFIAAVALLVLGPRRLPELARALGKGVREFRDAMSDGEEGNATPASSNGVPPTAAASTATPAPAQLPPPAAPGPEKMAPPADD